MNIIGNPVPSDRLLSPPPPNMNQFKLISLPSSLITQALRRELVP